MPVDPMSSAWAKYHWAGKHMERVDAAVRRSIDPKIHSISFEVNVEGNSRTTTATVRIASLPIIRPDLGLALGDVIHSFRSALDHLAWALVKVGADPRPAEPNDVYWPMARNGKHFDRRIDAWLPGVPTDYRAIARRYQPYGRGERSKAMRQLQRLSNMDKHRVLIPAVVNHSQIECNVTSNWPITKWEWLVTRPRALHVGTPVVRVGLARGDGSDCKVQVEGGATIHPSLGYGIPVADAITLIRATVFEILATFDELL